MTGAWCLDNRSRGAGQVTRTGRQQRLFLGSLLVEHAGLLGCSCRQATPSCSCPAGVPHPQIDC